MRRRVDKNYAQILGENVKRLRESKGLSQRALARLLDAENEPSLKNMIHKLEHAEGNLPIYQLIPIANALDTTVYDLLNGIEDFEVNKNCKVNARILEASEYHILEIYNLLNARGKQKVVEFAKDLDASGLYAADEE